jgi:predicted transcriptional regulator
MARTQISIKLDSTTLERVDEAAAYLGMTRTALIEHAVERRLKELDSVVEDMAEQGELTAAVFDRLTTSPKLTRAVAAVVAKQFTEDDLQAMFDRTPKLREEAQRRRSAKQGGKKKGKGGSGS